MWRIRGLTLSLGVLVLLCGCCSTVRHGVPAKTLHVADTLGEGKPGNLPQKKTVTLSVPHKEPGDYGEEILHRVRRDASRPHSENSVTPNITSKFLFNDSHHQMMVHWAGEGSPIILTLARDIRPSVLSSSKLYISYNYGKTFRALSLIITCPGRNRTGKPGVIDKFYHSERHNSHYLFPDTVHNVLFLTKDFGETINQACLPFKPTEVAIHPENSDMILAMDKDDPVKKLWGTSDFGITWYPVQENVKSFYWGIPPWDKKYDLYIERIDPMGNVVFRQSGLDTPGSPRPAKQTIIDRVIDFEIRDDYMFATRKMYLLGSRNRNGTLQLWVSYERKPFLNARLPAEVNATDFYVADASEQQVFLVVNDNGTQTDLYISDVRGSSFTLSLSNIVYFNPQKSRRDNWLRWYAKESFADLHKVDGLRSVYIASKLLNASDLSVENQISLISFDKGGLWEPIAPPMRDSTGKRFNCTLHPSPYMQPRYMNPLMRMNCSLHFSQLLSKWYPGIHTTPIMSHESAPGIIMASGVVGAKLSKKSPEDVFVSADAGYSWNAVLKGHYMYEFGDNGGLIVAVQQYHLTRRLEYSWNEGQTWETVYFSEYEMHVYGLLTEPGEMTSVFSIFGSMPGRHRWAIIQVDLKSIFPYTCGPGDYKEWSPGLGQYSNCLLGSRKIYQRRIAHAKCFNGRDFDRVVSIRNCTCTRQDFECDFGFKAASHNSMECVEDPLANVDPDKPPVPCIGLYDRTRGYRKISGDSCEGGEEHRYQPDKFVCPIRQINDFILYSVYDSAKRFVMGANLTETMNIPYGGRLPRRVLSLDYDYKRNCLYFADQTAIQSVCYAGGHRLRTLVTAVTRVTSLRYDWMSDNLVWIDSGRMQLAVSRADGRYKRILLSNATAAGTFRLQQPSSLALDPSHGHIYYIEGQAKQIVRVDMDGRNARVMYTAQYPLLALAYDLQTERIFMTRLGPRIYGTTDGYVYSMRSEGNDIRRLGHTVAASAITVYKGYVLWASMNRLYIADKYSGRGSQILTSTRRPVVDLVAIHQTAQQGSNACSKNNGGCTHLCVARPPLNGQHGANRTCLCPQTFPKVSRLADGNERCLCETGEVLNRTDGQCYAVSNSTGCGASMFMCGSGRCIPRSWICDHDDDCGDMSDEMNCAYHQCPHGMFRCNNNRCIPHQWRCDHDNDCHDHSDEDHCVYASCNSTQFTCDNGRCISARWRCDFDNDCHDHSDERDCTYNVTTGTPTSEFPCNTTTFHCAHGQFCVPRAWACDGADDCNDNSDERNCNATGTATPCSLWQFKCHTSGTCVQMSWVCDGANDCSDGSDELNCPTTRAPTTAAPVTTTTRTPYDCNWWQFGCRNGNCISVTSRCDGINDCGDRSDEDSCHGSTPSTLCAAGQFRCTDGSCIPNRKVCDQFTDCMDAVDEMNCDRPHVHNTTCHENQFTCDDGWCIYQNWVCDGEDDCTKGEDERNCSGVVHCREPERFSCLFSDGCLPRHWVCDGEEDCEDGSDEQQCNSTLSPTTVAPATCREDQFMCDNTQCIERYMRCNNDVNCYDGSDELRCPGVPEYVWDLHVPDKSYNSIHVRWASPSNNRTDGSYKFIPSIKHNGAWSNHSEISTTDYTFTKLIGFQRYTIRVYVVFVETGKAGPVRHIYPPGEPIQVTTPEGPPSAPVLLPPVVTKNAAVIVKWKRPNVTNGVIRHYSIYWSHDGHETVFTPPLNYVNDTVVNYTIPPLHVQGTYNVSVSAWTVYESPRSTSRLINYQYDLSKYKVHNLAVTNIGDTSADVSWVKPSSLPSGATYRVEVLTDNQLVFNTTVSKELCSLTKLAPGSPYEVFVVVQTTNGDGPPIIIRFATKGTPPPKVTGLTAELIANNVVRVKWASPSIKPSSGTWNYTVYYDYKGENMQEHTIRTSASKAVVKDKTMVVIRDLFGCEQYFIRVSITGPGQGPLSDEASVRTSFDPTHKPKHLVAIYANETLNLQWSVDCDFIVQPLGYIIRISESGKTHDFRIAPSKDSTIHHRFKKGMKRGAEYEIAVKADVPHGVFCDPITEHIPPLSAPTNVRLQLLRNQDVIIEWEYKEKLGDRQTFEILFAHRHDNKTTDYATLGYSNKTLYAVSREDLMVRTLDKHPDVKASMQFLFKVRVAQAGGYNGQLSEQVDVTIDLNYHAEPSQTGVMSQTNWMSIVIGVVVVCVALVVALVVYAVRHRRLQRSFMVFANSRYDTRSGTTTFSSGDDLDDDDQPMITGFSDDEPLVIA